MEQNLFTVPGVVLIAGPGALQEITGSGGVSPSLSHHQTGITQKQQAQPDQMALVASTGTPGDGLTAKEREVLQSLDNKPEGPEQDPNTAGAHSRNAVEDTKNKIHWLRDQLNTQLNDKLGRTLKEGNLAVSESIDQAGRQLYEGNKAQLRALLERLHAIKNALPADAKGDRHFISVVIKTIETHASLDGKAGIVSLVGKQSAAHAEYQQRLGQLNQLSKHVEAFLGDVLPTDVARQWHGQAFLSAHAPQQLRNFVARTFDQQIQGLTQQLQLAKRDGNQSQVRQLTTQLNQLKEQRDTVMQQARVGVSFLQLADRARRTGNAEQLNDFFKVLEMPRNGLDQGVRQTLLKFKEQKDLTSLEAALNDSFSEFNPDRVETRSASRAETSDPIADGSMSTSSVTPASSNNDEPVEAVEAIKNVILDEDSAQESTPLETQSAAAVAEEHAEIQDDWSKLSQEQISMQIASSGVTMGITSAYYRSRSKESEIKKMVDKVIRAVESGNLDAIMSAMILISRSSKESLRKSASLMVNAMRYYEEQQNGLNKQLAELTDSPGNPTFSADLQRINNESNKFSSNRQAIVSVLRDVKAMVDELDNLTHSYATQRGRALRSLSSFQS